MATTAATAQAAEDAKLNHLVVTQLQKTKMCAMNQRGTCRDPKCSFAHSADELQPTPDLHKTAICRLYTRGQCHNASCKFAHGEQELRVTPQVYKTQLCNFFARGHCNKGKRCRHAHGEEELRSLLLQQQARTSSPALSEGTQSAGELETLPYCSPGLVDNVAPLTHEQSDPRSLQTSPLGGLWGQNAVQVPPEWWVAVMAAGVPNLPTFTTPPPSNMCYAPGVLQPTPEKVMPPFPGMQRFDSSNVAEPMKIALPGASRPGYTPTPSPPPLGVCFSPPPSPFDASALANDFVRMHSTASPLSGKDMMAMAMQDDAANLLAAKTAQAQMDFELATAKLKVKELQAKKQLFNAAQYAASKKTTGAPSPNSHFEHIMQTLQQQQSPTRTSSPTESEALQMQMPLAFTPPPPGLDLQNIGIPSGSPVPEFPQDGQRSHQSWHPADISLQRGTAWVI